MSVDIPEFVSDLLKSRVTLEVAGQMLKARGPGEVLTPEVLAILRQHKAEILAYLASEYGPSHLLHRAECPALTGGVCNCEPSLVSRRQAKEWGWRT